MKPGEIELHISEEIDIVKAVFEAKDISQSAGFSKNEQFMVSIVASELARNIYKYAGKGVISIALLNTGNRKGIEISAEDNGPGIDNTAKALQDHFSTGNSLGLGLPGVKRIMDEFTITSAPGKGTKITTRKWGKNA
ncbi:MAG: anti-sigma regulatory factor [Candidatus Aminicenantes bacterium]|nr:MAG: anti-sigma regulatory factor [Candidatus Aminicenantes bacterium]